MTKYIIDGETPWSESLIRIQNQETQDQILGGSVTKVFRKKDFSAFDPFENDPIRTRWVTSTKGWSCKQHLVEAAPIRPQIYVHPKRRIGRENLRSDVIACAHERWCAIWLNGRVDAGGESSLVRVIEKRCKILLTFQILPNLFCGTKVREGQMKIQRQEKVLRFDISVDDSLFPKSRSINEQKRDTK